MGNGTERVPGKMNETGTPVAEDAWNDTGDEPDIAMQDTDDVRLVSADSADSGKRADVYFAEILESTRSHIQILLNEGRVCKGNKPIKPNYKIKAGDVFQVILPRPVPLQGSTFPLSDPQSAPATQRCCIC